MHLLYEHTVDKHRLIVHRKDNCSDVDMGMQRSFLDVSSTTHRDYLDLKKKKQIRKQN